MSSRKLAVVTGASSGIGLEIAKLAAEGPDGAGQRRIATEARGRRRKGW
jgi:NAD(P)-dependent dehydrogenase (short-subunit alcohol dehydrogenase family)